MRVEFQPPSDFSSEESGSGRKKVWTYLGIGCGVVLLLVGLLFAVGTFRAVSCCSDLVDVGKRTMEAQVAVQQMSLAMHQGELDEAYRFLAPAYQEELDRDGFTALVAPHRDILGVGYPVLVDMQTRGESLDELREIEAWVAVIRFVPPRGQEVLVADFHLQWRGGEPGSTIEVTHIRLERRARPLAEEPPALAAQGFLRTLRQGDWEGARRQLTNDSPLRQGELDGFRAFIREHEAALMDPEVTIVSVAYGPQGTAVTVRTAEATIELTVEPGAHMGRIAEVVVRPASTPIEEAPPSEPPFLEEDEQDPVE